MNGWRKMRKRIVGISIYIMAVLSLAACTQPAQTVPQDETAARPLTATVEAGLHETENGTGAELLEISNIMQEEEEQEEDGSGYGLLTGAAAEQLSEEQNDLIMNYMDCYFRSVADLRGSEELAGLFLEPEGLQAEMNKNGLEYLIGIRSMQQTDLSLAGFYYELTIEEVNILEDGSIEVTGEEWNRQNFSRHPEVDSEQYGIRHRFVLVQQDGEWKIREHLQRDGIYWHLFGEYWGQAVEDIPDAENYFQENLESLLTEAEEQLETWNAGTNTEIPQFDHAYDREQAVLYADEWIGTRNGEWADYTGRGGNCQNYASQCLLAGGIPMDREGSAVWKWYGEDLDNGSSAAGRSSSWTGVDEFWQYAAQNEGFGLAAAVDCPFDTGEAGDLIRMGFPENWNHVVIITDVVMDEAGETVDYLIDSNTSDMKNFPASAYPLPCRSLIKIYGWNE